MKRFIFNTCLSLLISAGVYAQQHVKLPHGMVFGSKPTTVGLMPASRLESFMGNRSRISAAIVGKVIKVTQPKGGWFVMDAGPRRTITARFKNVGVVLPANLQGREVVISGTVTKQFDAFDAQRQAGTKQLSSSRSNHKYPLSFEVVGLMVNK